MLANPPGGASGIPAHTFFAGSDPTVITPVVGFRLAVFHVPHTLDGAWAFALFPGSCCQSPPLALGFAVTSVMNSAGKIGRPNGSVPASRLPAVGRHPTWGAVTQPGVPGNPDTVPLQPLCVTPSDSACSSLYHSLIASFTEIAHCPAPGLKVRSTPLSLNTVAREAGRAVVVDDGAVLDVEEVARVRDHVGVVDRGGDPFLDLAHVRRLGERDRADVRRHGRLGGRAALVGP